MFLYSFLKIKKHPVYKKQDALARYHLYSQIRFKNGFVHSALWITGSDPRRCLIKNVFTSLFLPRLKGYLLALALTVLHHPTALFAKDTQYSSFSLPVSDKKQKGSCKTATQARALSITLYFRTNEIKLFPPYWNGGNGSKRSSTYAFRLLRPLPFSHSASKFCWSYGWSEKLSNRKQRFCRILHTLPLWNTPPTFYISIF